MLNLSIVIPIYNESENIINLVNSISKNIKVNDYEIIFVDDNSNDGSEGILEDVASENNKVKFIIRKNHRRDLSKSCILGFDNVKYDTILVMDGDLQHDPKDINNLTENFVKRDLDFVIGSRNLFKKKNEGLGFVRLNSSKILILIISLLLGKKSEDPMSGFFIFRKEFYIKNKEKLYAKGYKILLDLIYSSNQNVKIEDVDINFKSRSEGKSKMGTKIIYLLILCIMHKFFKKKWIF